MGVVRAVAVGVMWVASVVYVVFVVCVVRVVCVYVCVCLCMSGVYGRMYMGRIHRRGI